LAILSNIRAVVGGVINSYLFQLLNAFMKQIDIKIGRNLTRLLFNCQRFGSSNERVEDRSNRSFYVGTLHSSAV
jgi:hypothetical protein